MVQVRQQTVFPNFRYAIARVAGGAATLLVESGVTEVPGTSGAPFDLLGTVVADDGVVLFYGEGGGRRGVYQWSGDVVTTVVDDQTVLPPNVAPVSIFNSSDVAFANDGADVALVLTESNGGVWKRVAGTWTPVIARNAPIPGGVGGMSDLGAPAIRDGVVAFFGGRDNQFSPPKQAGLYTDMGGVVHPIADLQTDYGADVLDRYDVAASGSWFDGLEVAFAVQDAGADWRALYRATPVPEPGGATSAIAALLSLAACAGSRTRSRAR